jgi:hypothetical protein
MKLMLAKRMYSRIIESKTCCRGQSAAFILSSWEILSPAFCSKEAAFFWNKFSCQILLTLDSITMHCKLIMSTKSLKTV